MAHAKLAKHQPGKVAVQPLDLLKPAKINPRTHSPEQDRQLAAIIRRYGWTRPIMYDYEVGELVVGHGASNAARLIFAEGDPIWLAPGRERGGAELPAGHLPVLDVTGWTAEERRAYLIADNAIAEQAGWDWKSLGSELRDLEAFGFDLDLTGFNPQGLDDIFARIEEPQRDLDEVPPPPRVAVSRPGDIWHLGPHRLLCGDSTDGRDVERLGGGQASLTLTDPPYGIGFGYSSHDDRDNEANARLVDAAFALGPRAKVWTPGLNNLARDIGRFGETRMAVWHKGFAAAGNGIGGASTFEPILILDPPRRDLANNYIRCAVDHAEVDGENLGDLHPCPKPVELYETLVRAFSDRGAAIFEPFGGSGTTLIACERTGRVCLAIEIDPAYCDVIVARWQQLTHDEAKLEGGLTFAMVKAERLVDA